MDGRVAAGSCTPLVTGGGGAAHPDSKPRGAVKQARQAKRIKKMGMWGTISSFRGQIEMDLTGRAVLSRFLVMQVGGAPITIGGHAWNTNAF